MASMKFRNTLISVFVIVWLCVFHYESIRHFYLQPHFSKPLPKVPLLFPPAGWIMFYHVDDRSAYAQVYGVRNGVPQPIDPHEIVRTRFIGFDMVKRNVLSTMLHKDARQPFCRHLRGRFPEFERFVITAVEYPSLVKSRFDRREVIVYQCP